MTKIFLIVSVAFLSVLGLAEVLHTIKRKLLSVKLKPEIKLVVYLGSDTPDLQLASVVNEYNWNGCLKPESVFAVYSDLSAEQLNSCQRIAQKYDIILCHADEVREKQQV